MLFHSRTRCGLQAVNAGTVKLVGTDTDAIVSETALLLDDEAVYNTMSRAHNPYGDGKARKVAARASLRGTEMRTQRRSGTPWSH